MKWSYSGHLYLAVKTATSVVYVFLLEGWYGNNVELPNVVIYSPQEIVLLKEIIQNYTLKRTSILPCGNMLPIKQQRVLITHFWPSQITSGILKSIMHWTITIMVDINYY